MVYHGASGEWQHQGSRTKEGDQAGGPGGEASRTCGYGAELTTLIQEHCFYHLEAPIERVTGWDTPYPHALEWHYFPGPERVKKGLTKVMQSA